MQSSGLTDFVIIHAFAIGTVIGAIPGLGPTPAGFLSYSVNRQAAKDRESFGKGDLRGSAKQNKESGK